MEYAEKIGLLKKYDFSAWREVDRGNEETSIVTNLSKSYSSLTNLADKINSEKSLDFSREAIQHALSYYDRVQWDELDLADSDFKWIADYYEKLKEYAEASEVFFKRYEKENFNCSREWEEFKKVEEIFNQIKIKNYRREVLSEHGIMFED